MCSLGRRRQGRHDGDPPAPLHAYARLAQQQGGALSSSRHIVVSRGRAQRSTHTSLPRACDGIFPRRTLGAAARVHSRGVGGARGQGFRPRSEAVSPTGTDTTPPPSSPAERSSRSPNSSATFASASSATPSEVVYSRVADETCLADVVRRGLWGVMGAAWDWGHANGNLLLPLQR